jgi:hypothetical protein
MMRGRGFAAAAAVAVAAVLAGMVLTAPPAWPVGAPVSRATASPAICGSSSHPALAARIGRDIRAARRGRVSVLAVGVYDPGMGLGCWLDRFGHFDSASVVKVIILGALLCKAEDQDRYLTQTEADRARAMITKSDNDAASALWTELGHRYLQHFLNLTGMTHTLLGPDGAWGLTQITANDEIRLLRFLLNPNAVLDPASRGYALRLMDEVIPSERWGVPAGAPTSLTAHVKNGWLPLATYGWRVNSIGCFTGHGGGYSIVVLTEDNPTMAYGVATIEAITRAINHDLHPTAASVVPASRPVRSWQTPDESIPAPPAIP